MQTATVDPLVGRTLEGRYRILGRIARGGMSTVYRAVDERLDRSVAVKVMSAALSADPAFSDRFSREARTAARLTHINAVAVYDQGLDTTNGHHVFLVMELVEGRTLRDLMRAHGRFSPAEAISIMEPMLGALAAAHRAGIVHRDVKPENILLSDSGVVKVADFGLARAIEADAESTRTGLMMGTVAYCSPEQITRGYADPRSDVYSAGIVLFEMLTGSSPFKGESAMNVAYQHVHSRVPAPSSRVKGIPSEIDELVINATDSDPTGRPTDAAEFLAEIAETRAELALPVVPVPPRERGAAATGSGHSTARTEVIDAGVAGHDTQLVPGRGPRRSGLERDARDHLPPPPIVIPPKRRKPRSVKQQRRRRGLIALIIIVLLGVAAAVAGWWFASGRYSTIPDVRGQSLSQAEQVLQDAGYKIGARLTAFDHTAPVGNVTVTDPAGGDRLVRGKTVSLTVSQGKDMVAVPSVAVGTPLQQAQTVFQSLRIALAPTPGQSFSNSVPAGDFLKSDPAAGTKVERGYTTVTLYISKGPDYVSIPTISQGTPSADAQAVLKKAGFAVTETDAFSDSVDAGGVISVDPTGQQVRGQKVTVTVSKGPEFVTVPSIPSGTSYPDAQAQLEALGLKVKKHKVYGGFLNQVVGMSPAARSQVHPGDTITLDVV